MLNNLQTSLPSLQSWSASGTEEACLNSLDLDSCLNNGSKINTNSKKVLKANFWHVSFFVPFQISSIFLRN